MDSWTPKQLELMRAGGNDAMNNYLHARGVSKTASIQEKYNSMAAQLYKEVIKARAEGRPEPTELPKKAAAPKKKMNITGAGSNSNSSGGGGGGGGGSTDPNGLERLAGESDSQYIARQTRLREEARKRMAAKFGNNNGSKRTMGGIGSAPHPSSSSSYNAFNMDSLTGTLSSGLGTAASGFSSAFSLAKDSVSSVDTSSATNVAKDVSSMGMGLWNTFSSATREVASNLNADGLNMGGVGGTHQDGLASLRQQMEREKNARASNSGSTTYAGIGSDSFGASTRGSRNSNSNSNVTNAGIGMSMASQDSDSASPLPGESDQAFMQRQLRIRENAQATAQAAPLNKGLNGVTKMKVEKDDDFFASFGA